MQVTNVKIMREKNISVSFFIKMFYDFNIPYPNASDAADLERVEKILDRIHSCN